MARNKRRYKKGRVKMTVKDKKDVIYLVCASRYNSVNPVFIRRCCSIVGARIEQKIIAHVSLIGTETGTSRNDILQ